ncbi:hypothetical protein [Candidatus Poriferisocius sp.]|uniref:hypothetical protein n=1 Tax=Candidatus Poriferisocius sp. TaxID=3101276 RepID=UPI003B022230
MNENLSVNKKVSMNIRASEGQERRRRRFRRDDESGLTTLEWLLIVAAVAGLAALAVVLVTQVVEDTSEQISGNNARQTAAQLAAADVNRLALETVPSGSDVPVDSEAKWDSLRRRFQGRCQQLGIIYSDIEGLTSTWNQLPHNNAFTQARWATSLAAADTSGITDHGCVIAVP